MVLASFLSGGPSFAVDLPDGFLETPVLSSPLGFYRGDFHRELVYRPLPLSIQVDRWLSTECSVSDHVAFDGNEGISGYDDEGEENEGILQTFIRWACTDGAIYGHIRAEDRVDLRELFANLEVVDSGSHPIVLTSGHLVLEGRTAPGYEESIEFARFDQDTLDQVASIYVRRPGWLAPSVSQLATGNHGSTTYRAGVTKLIDITLTGVGNEEETIEVADQLVQAIQDMSQG